MSIEIDGKRYGWNQPICVACWNARHDEDEQARPTRGSTTYVIGAVRRCAYCGGGTTSGILVRDDPSQVPFPALDTDDVDEIYRGASLEVSVALALEIGAPE